MSDLSPYERLGVTKNASFDEIQEAKKKLTLKYQNDTAVVETIEAAYDAIIMDRLRMRQEGKIKVPDQIRFPVNKVSTKVSVSNDNTSNTVKKAPSWLQKLMDNPSVKEVSISGVIFLVLAIITAFAENHETLPFLLTIGVGTSFYFLYQKQRFFWRSVGIIFVVFIFGISLGNILATSIINSGLSISITSEQFSAMFTFFLFWLASNFFR